MPDLPALTAAVAAKPDNEAGWQALAAWFHDNGEGNLTASLRVFCPALRDSLSAGRSLDWSLEYVRQNAG